MATLEEILSGAGLAGIADELAPPVSPDFSASRLARKSLAPATPKIDYGDDAWRLAHIVARVLLKCDGGRQQTISVTIRPPSIATFPRARHKNLIQALLDLNRLTTKHHAGTEALAAE